LEQPDQTGIPVDENSHDIKSLNMAFTDENSTYHSGWGSQLSVGIPEIDEEHRLFFSRVNDLDMALFSRKNKAKIQELMDVLIADAIIHFEHEERLFVQYQYPEFTLHIGGHAQIVDELMKIKLQFSMMAFRTEWIGKSTQIRDLLINHLLKADMKYRDFFRDLHEQSP
jgi:hemerythrin